MAVPVFGVDADGVRDDCFAQMDPFSATTNPTLASVTRVITEQAAHLQGRLLRVSISATVIDTGGATYGPYVMCASVLKLMVAVSIARNMTGANKEVVQAWRDEIEAWFKALDKDGATFLGDPSLQTGETPPDGPSTHLTFYGLDVSSGVTPSSIDPIFTRDDKL